jgi:FOG: TPR repeat, SEL1 subfamily
MRAGIAVLFLIVGVLGPAGGADLTDRLVCEKPTQLPPILLSKQFDGWFNDKIPELLGKLSSPIYRNATARVMGERYEHGQGTARDPAKAVEWYRKAALIEKDGIVTAGDGFAMRRLGEMYRDGIGVARDGKRADVLLKCATLQGGDRSMVPQEPAFFDQFRETGPEPAAAPSTLLDREIALYSLPQRVFALAWSPDGSRVAVSFEDDRQITLLDAHDGKRLWAVERKLSSTAKKPVLVFSPDGNRLYIRSATALISARNEIVSVLSVRDGAVERTLSSGDQSAFGLGVAKALASSRERVFVVPDALGNAVVSFDTESWTAAKVIELPKQQLEPGKGFVSARLALDDRRGMLFWAHEGVVQPIPLKGGKPMSAFQAFQLDVEGMQINPVTGELVVGGTANFQSSRVNPSNEPKADIRSYHDASATLVRAFDPISGKQTKVYLAPGATVGGVSVSQDGKFIAATKSGTFKTGGSSYLHLWDAATGRLLASRDMGNASVSDVSFSPDGKQLCFAEGNTIHILEIVR